MAVKFAVTLVRLGTLVSLTALLSTNARAIQGASAPRDGQHDFDFNLGTWKVQVSRLKSPLSGSTTWVEYNGVGRVSKVWGGRANLLELGAEGPAGRVEGMGLRLYNAETGRWSINWASSRDGALSPMIGGFENGRGEFFDSELFDGKPILCRNSFFDITPNSARFEQAFSADGGKTWEANFIIKFTRAGDGAAPGEAAVLASASPLGDVEVSHDFDWEFGSWNLEVKRLIDPLNSSTTWMPMRGTVAVRKIWGGRANLAEIDVTGPKGRVEFLALRLYNPGSRQWTLSFSTVGNGTLSPPMYGEFKNGRGEFYDQESFRDREILVRFAFSGISANAGQSEQAFSADGGKTWETNWVNRYTRAEAGSR